MKPPLELLFYIDIDKKERNKQISNAYIKHGYTQKEIAVYLGLHPSTVSKILKKERDEFVNKNNFLGESEYDKALKKCYEVAEQEAKAFSDKLPQLVETLNKSIEDLNKIIQIIKQHSDIKDKELENTFETFHDILKRQLNSDLKIVSNSLEKKRKHLSSFTVTLFGRTKAGKSTLREALTHGDGSSIGKGGQRTTREVKEYSWNKLRIIDTPGIAAYEGEEDIKIAKSVLDESDLIFFLVTSDSIQPSEFEKLAEIKANNKPVIILLNVKEDIDHPIRFKRFLNNYDKIISSEEQQGNIQRLMELSKEYFEHSLIEILPIHALAAFKSHHTSDSVQKEKLYSASGINQLKVLLQEMIISQGTQKRIQSFRDDYIFYLNSFASTYQVFHGKIEPRISYLKENYNKIIKWFDSFIPEGKQLIEDRVKEIFSPLYLQINSFVDRHHAGDEWKKKVEAIKIEEQSEEIGNEIKSELQEYLEEFARELDFDMRAIDFDGQADAVSGVRKGIKGKVLRWGSALLGLTDGALAFVSAMNWWNPVGWVTGAIGAGSFIAGIVSSWFADDDSKRYEEKKQEAKIEIRSNTEKMERKTKNEIRKWFDDKIVTTLKDKLEIEINDKLKSLELYLNQLERDAKEIENRIMEENRTLFIKLFNQTLNKGEIFQNNIIAVSRDQGLIAKVLIRDKKVFEKVEDQERLENIIGERIIYVEYIDDDPVKLFQRAICPIKLNHDVISFDPKSMTYKIRVDKSQVNEVIGNRESNIKTTRQLLQAHIEIEEV